MSKKNRNFSVNNGVSRIPLQFNFKVIEKTRWGETRKEEIRVMPKLIKKALHPHCSGSTGTEYARAVQSMIFQLKQMQDSPLTAHAQFNQAFYTTVLNTIFALYRSQIGKNLNYPYNEELQKLTIRDILIPGINQEEFPQAIINEKTKEITVLQPDITQYIAPLQIETKDKNPHSAFTPVKKRRKINTLPQKKNNPIPLVGFPDSYHSDYDNTVLKLPDENADSDSDSSSSSNESHSEIQVNVNSPISTQTTTTTTTSTTTSTSTENDKNK
jgi:hypothetical protein